MRRAPIPKSIANPGYPGSSGAEDIINWLFYVIDEKGLTLDQVAEVAGISPETLKKWYARSSFPRLDMVVACLEYLGYELKPIATGVRPSRDMSKATRQRGGGPYYPIDEQWLEVELKRDSQSKHSR